jgi:hypothetical protein
MEICSNTYNGYCRQNFRFYVYRFGLNNIGAAPQRPVWNQTSFLYPPGSFDYVNKWFIIPTTGLYSFVGGAEITLAAAGTSFIDFWINGLVWVTASETTSVAKTIYPNNCVNLWLQKGDTVEYRIYQDSGLNATIGLNLYQTFFCGTSVYIKGQ